MGPVFRRKTLEGDPKLLLGHPPLFFILFVDLESCVPGGEEIHDLRCGRQACVHIGFSRLRSHFLRCGEDPLAAFLVQFGLSVGSYVRDIFQVRSVCQGFFQLCLVDDFLAGSIQQASS